THADRTRWFADLCIPEKCRYRDTCATAPFHESLYGGPVRSVCLFQPAPCDQAMVDGTDLAGGASGTCAWPLAVSSTHERSMGTRVVVANGDDLRPGIWSSLPLPRAGTTRHRLQHPNESTPSRLARTRA